jgi:hypothetical protein
VRAGLRALLDDDDGDVLSALRGALLETDRSRQASGTGTDDHDIEFHTFAGGKLAVGFGHGRAPLILSGIIENRA